MLVNTVSQHCLSGKQQHVVETNDLMSQVETVNASLGHVRDGQNDYLAVEAGMSEGVHNVGVAQVFGEGYFHGGPVRGALDVFVLCCSYDLHKHRPLKSGCNEFHDLMTKREYQEHAFSMETDL